MSSERTIPEAGIVDRYSGREADEFGVDDRLSVAERLSRFENAEVELLRAEAQVAKGESLDGVYGSFEDIKDVVALLRRSAEYHASGFTREELAEAADKKTISVELLQMIADRRADESRHYTFRPAYDRLRVIDEGRPNEADRDVDRDKER